MLRALHNARSIVPARLASGTAPTVALLVLGMATFGSGTPTSRIVGRELPAFVASGLRVLLGAAVLVSVMVVVRRRAGRAALPRVSRADALVLAGISLFGMFGFSLLMLFGMREVGGAVGAIVMGTTPAVTALGAVAFMGDRPGRLRWTGIALAAAGAVAVGLGGSGAGSGTLWLGVLLVFGAVCGEAAYTLLGKRLTADLSALEVAALASAGAVLLFAPLAAWQAADVGVQASPGQWAAVLWWGAGTLALGSVLWYSGVQRVPGSVAAGFMAVMPVSALLLSYWLLGEPFRWIHLLGLGLVLAATGAMVREDTRDGDG